MFKKIDNFFDKLSNVIILFIIYATIILSASYVGFKIDVAYHKELMKEIQKD